MISTHFLYKPWTTILLCVAAILIALGIFLPLWQIQLYAPQYPEGLILLIYANKLAGNVDIINGLNHYIGMQVLDAKNFPEFSVLRYLLGAWAVIMLVVGFVGKKKWLNILLISFVVFSLLAMADFYRWNYNYGHNLDPNAAIQVPGMSYQPPLIGYKQLLNFGAYAMPAVAGWCYIGSGLLILFAFIMENKVLRFFKRKQKTIPAAMIMLMITLASCSGQQPRPVRLNQDNCDQCKMTITDARFATQVISKKGRQYLFDDMRCMVTFRKDHPEITFMQYYASDFCAPHSFLEIEKVSLLTSDSLRSPMGGNIAAFSTADSTRYYQQKFAAKEISWAIVNK